MIYKITHSTKYTYTEPVSACHNYLHLGPRDSALQKCEYHRVVVHPVPADRDKCDDYFGNHVEYFSIHQPHRRLTVTATSRVRVEAPPPDVNASPPWEDIVEQLRTDRSPDSLNASQFTAGSPRIPLNSNSSLLRGTATNGDLDMADDAQAAIEIRRYAIESFTPGRPLLEAAQELNARIHADFAYDSKATTLNTPLWIAFKQRRGVCQDFAHVGVACLRSLGLAARYVSGYLRTDPPPGKPRMVRRGCFARLVLALLRLARLDRS